jgi:putative photosynthetic complex assembly protein
MAHIEHNIIPKGALPLVFALVGFSLVTVTVAVLMPGAPKPSPLDGALQSAELRFADIADGGIAVTTSAGVTVLPPDTNGFVRGAMRAMARERKTRAIGPNDPFVLALRPNGRLDLVDPDVGTVIDLRAFGADNARSFAALMPLAATETAAIATAATTSRE